MAGGCRAIRGAIETPVGMVAAAIETVLDPVTAPIEALLDAIAAAIGALARTRPNLRGANQQSQTEPYCTAFHDRPP
jgi:ABC-type transporter Mla subunit MlaD